MASIIELIKNIRNARLGKDVRESIASAIEQTYEDASKDGNANMEVAQARGVFNTLKNRLDNSDNLISENRTTLETEIETRQSADSNLQNQINGLASGSPLVASSVNEMTDTTRVYVNTSDGKWYYYNGSRWVAGNTYQSAALIYDLTLTEKNQIPNSKEVSKFLFLAESSFSAYVTLSNNLILSS